MRLLSRTVLTLFSVRVFLCIRHSDCLEKIKQTTMVDDLLNYLKWNGVN